MKLGVPWTAKGKKSPAGSAQYEDADAASVHGRLDDLTRQLERLSRITAGKVRPPAMAVETREQPPPDDDADPYERVNQRLEQFAAETRGSGDEVARYAGDRSLNRNPLQAVYADTGSAHSESALDRTLAEIAARQRTLDGGGRSAQRGAVAPRPMAPPSQNLSGLEEQLRKITSQIDALRRPTETDDALPALRQELADISRSLAEAMPRRAIEAIETEVRSLAERLDDSRQSGVDGSALANLEHGLAEVRDALHTLKPAESLAGFQTAIQGLSRKIDNLTSSQQDPAVLHQLEAAITGLRGIVAHVASDDTLARLTEEVRGIAERIEHSAPPAAAPDSLVNLERQIGAIAEAIDESNAQGRQVPAKLESMVRGLSEKIEAMQPNRGDTIAFGQLEERITKLVEKLDSSGSRFNHLEAIERGLADVLVHLEGQRSRGSATPAPGSDQAVESLKRELDAVNGTLNRVVDRLATIETGIRGGRSAADATAAAPPAAPPEQPKTAPVPAPAPPPSRVASAPPPKPAPSAPPAKPASSAPVVVPIKTPVPPAADTPAAPAKPVASPSERLAAAAQVPRPAPRERTPIDASLPPDHPLEPGAARTRISQSPADRIAESEAALGPSKPPTAADAGGRTNFIAAARRAAQTALRLPAESAGDAAPGHADDEPQTPMRRRLAGRVRSLLVGASVVILAVGAFRIAMTLIDPADDPPEATATTQGPDAPRPSKSTARKLPDPLVTGSTRDGEDSPGDRSGLAATAPTADAVPQATAAPQDVTGSIPNDAAAQNERTGVPLPLSRPGQGSKPRTNGGLFAAASEGDPAAAYELAVRHIDGRDGVRRSYEEAARWLEPASRSLAPAQFRLGSLYEKGLGVRKDLKEARRLYAAAAEKGNAKAMHNLAVLYAEGIDGRPNYQAAAKWFRKAANHGITDSQYNLGVLFARGAGIEQNLAESFKWFSLAAQQGDGESARKRDDIAGRLDAESLIAARLAIKTWTPVPQPEEAVTVKAPPGGWDPQPPAQQPSTPPPSAKRGPRPGAPLKLGPG